MGILKKPNNELWLLEAKERFGDLAGGIVKLGPGLSVVQRNDFPQGFNISSLSVDEEGGYFWFGIWGTGLYRFDPRDSSFLNIRHVTGDTHSLKSDIVNAVCVDRDSVWNHWQKKLG